MTAVPHQFAAVRRGWLAKLMATLGLMSSQKRGLRNAHSNRIAAAAAYPGNPANAVVITAADDLAEEEAVRLIHAQAREAIASGATLLMVDLADVIKADTKIVACLIVLRRMARRSGCALDVRLSPAVAAWTGVCRVQQVIHDKDSRTSAA